MDLAMTRDFANGMSVGLFFGFMVGFTLQLSITLQVGEWPNHKSKLEAIMDIILSRRKKD